MVFERFWSEITCWSLPFSVGLRKDTVQAGTEFRRLNFIIYSESVVFFIEMNRWCTDVLMEVEAISLVAGNTAHQSLQRSGLKQCIEFWGKVWNRWWKLHNKFWNSASVARTMSHTPTQTFRGYLPPPRIKNLGLFTNTRHFAVNDFSSFFIAHWWISISVPMKKTFYAVTFPMQLALKKIFRFGNFFILTKDYF